MSDNYKDKDSEDLIFRWGLASGAIEPSEKFWNKAYESILQRDNLANRKRVSRWRGAFFIMGTVTLLLGSYIFYMHSEVNDIKQQLTKIESNQINTVQQNVSSSQSVSQSVTANIPEKSPAKSNVTLENEVQKANTTNGIAAANKITTNTFPAKASSWVYSKHNSNSGNALYTTSSQSLFKGTSNTNAIPASINNSSTFASGAGNAGESTSMPITASASTTSSQINNAHLSSTIIHTQDSSAKNNSAIVANKKADSVTAVLSRVDSINLGYEPSKPITIAGILSKFSVSTFYTFGMANNFLDDDDQANGVYDGGLQAESDNSIFVAGLRIAYDVSDKWTIQTGFSYKGYSYNIDPATISAQQEENGQIGYSMQTISGTCYIPYTATPIHVGDSIKVKGSSSSGYISIPLQAKYKFAAGTKLDFYAVGGFAVNIASYQETQMHWENTTLQEGDVNINSMYDIRTIQYSYNVGIGAEYLIWKGLSVYAEPFIDGSFTSINKYTPTIVYPYFLGLSLGASYHF